ncbi:M48 family metalloprotease [Sphaerisporangium sp. TRM90804]|uniref:M48 family metalloprotease n=1 Tax=Sphaerisporangium sp. TRM90804 TaxID=3031113 RepID=UPI00244894C5|nr:M48 family metalloprotease [Sphaerisporangium sp. TRM90804]MDH2426910.1 M48 family metalloprotease [Sphaerisporangium sp. TRM90804]
MTGRTMHDLVLRMIAVMALLALMYAGVVGAMLLAGVAWQVVVPVVAVAVLLQWWAAEGLARTATGAEIVDAGEEPELHGVLDRLCALNDVPKPRVAVSPDPVPNAFTLGRSERHTTIVVTRGLLEVLEPDELGAALAHEVAHIRHRDVAVMTLAGSLAIAMAWGAKVARDFVRRNSGPAPILQQILDLPVAFMLVAFYPLIILLGLCSLLAQMPLRALGRYRELAADHDAAVQTRQPALLAAALLKIGDGGLVPRTDLRAAARVPATSLVAAKPVRWAWWSTHPAIARRVDRLTALSGTTATR